MKNIPHNKDTPHTHCHNSPLQDMRKYIIFATSKKGMGLPCYKPLKKLIVPVVS